MVKPKVNKLSSGLKYSDKINKEANRILLEEDILDYVVKVAHIQHRSDDDLFKIAILSLIQHSIKDYDYGLYLNIVGSAGKGKSHSLNVLSKIVPDDWVYKTSITPKSLYQASDAGMLDSVKIIFSDDINFINVDLIETLKKATSEFDSSIMHMTLVHNEPKYFTIKSGISYWFTSVASIPDSQLSSRFINISVDESQKTDDDVMKMMTKNALGIKRNYNRLESMQICKCIFDKICSNKIDIVAPFAEAIGYNDVNDRRLIQSFLSTFKCVVFLNRFKRQIINDQIIADIDDFNQAVSIFSKVYDTHKSKLSKPELKIRDIIIKAGKISTQDIQKSIKLSDSILSANLVSLLEKVPNLSVVRENVRGINKAGEEITKSLKFYIITSATKIDNNQYMPKGKLADIYIRPDIYNDVVDDFWRQVEDMEISEAPEIETINERIIKSE